jgi:hypothetical protein
LAVLHWRPRKRVFGDLHFSVNRKFLSQKGAEAVAIRNVFREIAD